jgi:hypothetical protein
MCLNLGQPDVKLPELGRIDPDQIGAQQGISPFSKKLGRVGGVGGVTPGSGETASLIQNWMRTLSDGYLPARQLSASFLNGPTVQRTNGPKSQRANGPLIKAPLKQRTQHQWTRGPRNRKTFGPSDHWKQSLSMLCIWANFRSTKGPLC